MGDGLGGTSSGALTERARGLLALRDLELRCSTARTTRISTPQRLVGHGVRPNRRRLGTPSSQNLF